MSESWSFEPEQVRAPQEVLEQRVAALEGGIRRSVGLQGIEDLEADLDAGFRAAKEA